MNGIFVIQKLSVDMNASEICNVIKIVAIKLIKLDKNSIIILGRDLFDITFEDVLGYECTFIRILA